GWERDVHYDLTRWLALQAGLSEPCADTIARFDQSLDDRYDTAAIPQMVWVHVSADPYAARGVQLNHFPALTPPPSLPPYREVVKDSPAAQSPVRAALDMKVQNGRVIRFGQALHPFQDSWSHQGVSGVPFLPMAPPLNPFNSFSHPLSRGGWWSHDADLTRLHPDEVVEVAQRTYDYILELRTRNPNCVVKPAAPRDSLIPAVKDYAMRETKSSKSQWLKEHGLSQDKVPTLTVRGHGAEQMTVTAARPPAPETPAPAGLVASAKQFSDAWFSKNTISAAELVDLSRLRSQFTEMKGPLSTETGEGSSARRDWALRFMAMYLVDDHAAVNELGHGNPMAPGYEKLPLKEAGDFQFWKKINPPALIADDFIRSDDGTYALVFVFDQMPHDAVILTWSQRGDTWVVSGMLGMVD
ncbi:MAG TPA: hypothetical protein VNN08_00755, partial [Thermoanaerobaculia bacterium]|nr:hypothetical protein [Thermoanaerobaculia bacterium]